MYMDVEFHVEWATNNYQIRFDDFDYIDLDGRIID